MSRKSVIERLINYEEPIEVLEKDLKGISWDSETELVVLSAKHLRHMIQLLKAGKITNNTIEQWANLIEGREDIGFEDEDVKNIIFEIANPVLYGAIDSGKIEKYYNMLSGDKTKNG